MVLGALWCRSVLRLCVPSPESRIRSQDHNLDSLLYHFITLLGILFTGSRIPIILPIIFIGLFCAEGVRSAHPKFAHMRHAKRLQLDRHIYIY